MEKTESFKSWLIAIGCCFITCSLICPFRLGGLIFVELIEKYNIDRSQASTPMFVFTCAMNIAGPLTGFIGKRIGGETIVLLGCLISSVSVGANFFAEDIVTVVMLLGVLYGIGFSASAMVLPSTIQRHFKENFNSANGIVSSGPCLAGFIFPSVAVILFQTYGLSGSLLIISGIMINSVPIAMLIMVESLKTRKTSMKNETTKEDRQKDINKILEISRNEKSERKLFKDHQSVQMSVLRNDNDLDEIYQSTEESFTVACSTIKSESLQKSKAVSSSIQSTHLEEQISERKDDSDSTEQFNLFMTKNCSTGDFCLNHAIEYPDSQTCYLQVKSLEKPPQQIKSLSTKSSNKKNESFFYSTMRLFLDSSFLILVLIGSISLYFIAVVRTTLIDYSRDKGIPNEYETYILMVQAVFDLIGRSGLVWVVDKGLMTSTTFTVLGFVMMALAMGGIVISNGIATLIIAASIFEGSTGAVQTILPGMLIECLEKDKIILAMPSRLILFVPISFTSYPLIGYFRNQLNSYDGLYYLLIALSLFCSLITPLAARCSKKINKNKTEYQS